MNICARERYAYADTSEAVRFLEDVLVPKVSAAYLNTMCASFDGCRDPRMKLSYFKGEPTHFKEEATRTITSELIERSCVDVGLPGLDDGFPKWFVDQYVWPLAINRTRRYVCLFVRWREALMQQEVKQALQFSHFLQPSTEFLDHLRVENGKLVDELDGDFAQLTVDPNKWPTSEVPMSGVHMNWARNHCSTYDLWNNGDPKPVFRAEGLLWHEFFWRLNEDDQVDITFVQADFSHNARRTQQEWLLSSFKGVSSYAFGNVTDVSEAMQRGLRNNLAAVMAQTTAPNVVDAPPIVEGATVKGLSDQSPTGPVEHEGKLRVHAN